VKRTITIVIALLFAISLVACSLSANDASDTKTRADISYNAIVIDEADPDYLMLKNITCFTNSGVGYGGEIPEQVYAFGRLFQKDNALNYFYKLEYEGSTSGKLYALCGLYYLDYDFYRYLIKEYNKSGERVLYMVGCLGYYYPMRKMIKASKADAVSPTNSAATEVVKINKKTIIRLKSHEDTVDEWRKRNPKARLTTESFDFYRGSFPDSVRSISHIQ